MSAQTDKKFKKAAEDIQNVSKRPTDKELLNLYALYKQATDGDVSGKRPSMINVKGRAKYDAWDKLKGLSQDESKKDYIDLVEKLKKKYK
jgi:diazepam-binding inhibitor (GABA receptor modulator, acyl-CoA-binding protein)